MATIRPFKGIRPVADYAEKIAALPYDVYNRAEAKEIVKKNPESFLAIDRAETNFPDDVDTYDTCVYEKAHDLLWQWVEEGRFVRDEKPCYYLYELTMNGRSQTGIVACASIDDYERGVIKKHENTRPEKEIDRIRHVGTCNAQTGPIFLAYRAKASIDTLVEKIKQRDSLYDFVSEDGIRHRVFIVNDPKEISTIESAFAKMNAIYIADGHHRAASAVRVGQRRRVVHPDFTGDEEFNYFLSILFPDNQLTIMDYNRVVKDLRGFGASEFLSEVKNRFTIVALGASQIKPEHKGQFSMFLDGTWYLCEIRPEDIPDDPVGRLDVSLLQNLLLDPVLGIKDPRTNRRIDFVGGIRGLDELERRCETDCAVAFAMYPTDIAELFAVADAHLLMPPKSTWFEPKPRSGLFIHEI